eukprot:scaffold21441_cov124-Isochrysis_galbana.AAC.1
MLANAVGPVSTLAKRGGTGSIAHPMRQKGVGGESELCLGVMGYRWGAWDTDGGHGIPLSTEGSRRNETIKVREYSTHEWAAQAE